MSEHIIERLSEIEGSAARVMEEALQKKERLSREFEEKKEEFTRRTALELEQNIEQFRQRTQEDFRQRLQKRKEAAENEMDALTKDYEANHNRYVRDLFLQMTGEEDAGIV